MSEQNIEVQKERERVRALVMMEFDYWTNLIPNDDTAGMMPETEETTETKPAPQTTDEYKFHHLLTSPNSEVAFRGLRRNVRPIIPWDTVTKTICPTCLKFAMDEMFEFLGNQ